MKQASATVFLRVLKDALFSGPGSADLLLPKTDLSTLLVDPALQWLAQHGAHCHLGCRVHQLNRNGTGWLVDDEAFDAVILACSATEAARLAQPHAAQWSASARAVRYEPIVTAYLADSQLKFESPMQMLRTSAQAPAQFAFDLGSLQHTHPGLFAFVVSSAGPWLDGGVAACASHILRQARQAFPRAFQGPDDQVVRHIAPERRATFACTPSLERPAMQVAPRLMAAGDHVAGPYPATLEGAVRSGQAAAMSLI
jgi:hypothetical protein